MPQSDDPSVPRKPATALCTVAEITPMSALRQGRICGLEKQGFPVPSLLAKDLRLKRKAREAVA